MKRILFTAVALAIGFPQISNAGFALYIDDLSTGGIDVIVADNQLAGFATGAGATTTSDGTATQGVLTFNGSTANFSVTITTALSKPILGNSFNSILDLTYTLVSSGAGTVQIFVTDTDYALSGLPADDAIVSEVINGNFTGANTAGSSVRFQSGFGQPNLEFVTTVNLDLATFAPPPAGYSFTDTEIIPGATNPFSLTLAVEFNATESGQGTTGDAFIKATTPEPATLAMWGFGAMGVLVAGRFRRKSA
jgi:PEP-CTERM motif-containing protein